MRLVQALSGHKVLLEGTLLKPNMVSAGGVMRIGAPLPYSLILLDSYKHVSYTMFCRLPMSCTGKR